MCCVHIDLDPRPLKPALYHLVACLRCRGFVYELARDGLGTMVGVVWQTATMRDNFERFGSYISLDMMKRGINSLLWPFVSVSMYNELKKIGNTV